MPDRYPFILPQLVKIPRFVSSGVRKLLDAQRTETYDISLSNGPFQTHGELSLHANEGPILRHHDGAGITFGLILIADGEQRLKVGAQQEPLQSGTFFAINSNLDHETLSGMEDLIAFVTMDFFHQEGRVPHISPALRKGWTLVDPDVEPSQFAEQVLQAARLWIGAS